MFVVCFNSPKNDERSNAGGEKVLLLLLLLKSAERKKPMAHRPTAGIFLLGLRENESNKKLARNSSILHPTVYRVPIVKKRST